MTVMLQSGLDITPAITHRFGFRDHEAAFADRPLGRLGQGHPRLDGVRRTRRRTMGTASRPNPLAFLDDELAALRERHLYRPLRVMSSRPGPHRLARRPARDQPLLQRLPGPVAPPAHEAGRASRPWSSTARAPGAVRTIAGTMTLHEALEAELAAFKHTEAVLTFQSGFTANTGVIPTITGETDLIVSDELNHASIIDGMRLSKAPRKVFRHADAGLAARGPRRGACEQGRDGHGRAVPADPRRHRRRVQHGRRHRAAAGHRRGGRGVRRRRHGGRRPRVAACWARTGAARSATSGSRAASPSRWARCPRPSACSGGYVAGSQALRDILVQRARPFLFSTSHPPAVAAACREAIRIMREEPELIERLWANTRRFKAELARLGFDTGRSETPITPVMLGDSETTIRFSQPPVRGGRVRHVGRVPDGRPGPGADPDDRHGRPHRRAARPGAGRVRPRRAASWA